MTTKDIIQGYFDSLKQKSRWDALLADGMAFTSFVTPIKQVAGKSAYLESTSRFFSMITAVEVKALIVDGDRACALTRYQLQPPGGLRVIVLALRRTASVRRLAALFDESGIPLVPENKTFIAICIARAGAG